MNKYIEAEMAPAGWKISYVGADGTTRIAIHGHNAIGDYRAIDAGATSEPIYAIAQPVQPVQPKDVDWQSVGKLIEANDRAKSLGFMPGTSNWGSMLWKAIVQPLQPTLTDQQVANMSEKHHREGLAEWSQPVQPTEPIGCVGKDGCTILYFTSELLPFETDLYIHPPA